MNHLVIGMTFPFLLGCAAYLLGGCRAGWRLLVGVPVAMGVCGCWALVPDLPLLLGLSDLYFRLDRDPRIDIFFWHYTLDRWEDCGWEGAPWNLVGLALMLLAVSAAAVRELQQRERGN